MKSYPKLEMRPVRYYGLYQPLFGVRLDKGQKSPSLSEGPILFVLKRLG